jgi:hypothetical protein
MIMTHVDLIEKLLKYAMIFSNNIFPVPLPRRYGGWLTSYQIQSCGTRREESRDGLDGLDELQQ